MVRLVRVLAVGLLVILCAPPLLFTIGPTREAFQQGEVPSGLVTLIIGGTVSLLTFWLALQIGIGRSSVGWALLRWLIAILVGFFGFAVSGPEDPSWPFKLPTALLTALSLLPFFFFPEQIRGSKPRAVGALISLAFALGGLLLTLSFGLLIMLNAQDMLLLFPNILPLVVFLTVLTIGFVVPPRAGTRWLAGMTAAWMTVALAVYRSFLTYYVIGEIIASPSLFAGFGFIVVPITAIQPLFFLLLAFFLLLPKQSQTAPFLFLLSALFGGISWYWILSLMGQNAPAGPEVELEGLLLLIVSYLPELLSGFLGIVLFSVNCVLARVKR
ncbi:MAG: hypothetical protein N2049_08505 [Anaerolineales bacterium]|nr:hypothetical protein [Anaerolineales bacterium]